MAEETNKEMSRITILQKSLIILVYASVIICVILSIAAIRNTGQSGYDSCISKRCEQYGQATCSKLREVNNCCLGAGGNIGYSDNKYVCTFI